jgi:Holliday junction resolvasome RuvABC endonuclease subunit
MKTLALDPASVTGYAHSNGKFGVWQLTRSSEPDGGRLVRLRNNIHKCYEAWGIDKIVFEDASFGSNNRNTAASHNELRGIIKMVAAELKCATQAINPGSLKAWATGDNHAPKPKMIAAVERFLGIVVEDDNAADALLLLEYARQGIKPAAKKPKSKRRRGSKAKEKTLF